MEQMSRDLIMLRHPNIMKWNQLLQLINDHKMQRYKLQFLAKYNLSDHFTELSISQDIIFQPTIRIYQDLNEIVVILKEELPPKTHHQTRCKRIRVIKTFTKKTI